MRETFRRKPNRLRLDAYRDPSAYFLTVRCAHGSAPFNESQLVRSCLDVLRERAGKHGFRVFAYCFMPDHLHLLVEGSEGSFVPDFVKEFKQLAGYRYRKLRRQDLWQKSYHDHVLRADEDTLDVARYIARNPVRAGLVEAARDYPFTGSFVWGEALVEA